MTKVNTCCRVCGKKYFCCTDSKAIHSWRAMACSIECYKEYMNRIEKSRTPSIEPMVPEKSKTRKKQTANVEANEKNITIED